MSKSKQSASNDGNGQTKPVKPILVYCIIGAVVVFNVVIFMYVMDRLAQLDKLKEDLIKSNEQYQEVPLPDLMKDKIKELERVENAESQAQQGKRRSED